MNIQFNKQFKNRRKFVKKPKENSQITVTQNHKSLRKYTKFAFVQKLFVRELIPQPNTLQ